MTNGQTPRTTRSETVRLPQQGNSPAGNTAATKQGEEGHQIPPCRPVPGAEKPSTAGFRDRLDIPISPPPGRTSAHGPRTPRLKAHSLIDKVYDGLNIYLAWRKVRSNKGAHGLDRVTIHMFEANLQVHLREIQRKLMQQRFLPSPVRRAYIPKTSNPKEKRPLGIPIVADRVVGQALLQVLDPLFDEQLSSRSFAYRKGRNTFGAMDTLIRDAKDGFRIVVDADIRSFFDRLCHRVVMSCVRRRIADGRVLDLILSFLKAGIYEHGEVRVPEEGAPQGGVISPWLANLVLDDLDKALEARGYRFVRYADDFLVLCKSRKEATEALAFVREILADLKLELNEEKTSISGIWAGFEFLGFRIAKDRITMTDRAIERFKDKVRRLTRRQQGRNVEQVLHRLNPVLRGVASYYGVAEVAKQFQALERWIRMRIRSFKTKKRRRTDNRRLPNKRLAKWGLLSLPACRPRRRLSFRRCADSESESRLLDMRNPRGVAQLR
jgi:RNA-directed DNA polymerase